MFLGFSGLDRMEWNSIATLFFRDYRLFMGRTVFFTLMDAFLVLG